VKEEEKKKKKKKKKRKEKIYVLQVRAVQRLASPETEKEYNNETNTGLYFYSFFGVLLRVILRAFGRGYRAARDYVSPRLFIYDPENVADLRAKPRDNGRY